MQKKKEKESHGCKFIGGSHGGVQRQQQLWLVSWVNYVVDFLARLFPVFGGALGSCLFSKLGP